MASIIFGTRIHITTQYNNEVTESLVGQTLGGVPTFATTWLALKHVSAATFNKSGLSFI